jgi:hypothetical protein
MKVDSWSAAHSVSYDLHETLLLHWITNMLVTLHVKLNKTHFLELERSFEAEKIVNDFLTISMRMRPVS